MEADTSADVIHEESESARTGNVYNGDGTGAVVGNVNLNGGELMRELESAGEVLTRVELDLACTSEKLVNLNIFAIHVGSRESDYEAFIQEKEQQGLGELAEKALEFDFMSGILDSEVRELDSFTDTLRAELHCTRDFVSSNNDLGEVFLELKEKLRDSEEALKRSQELVTEIMSQSADFHRILRVGAEEHWKYNKGVEFSENGEFSIINAKIKMQTAEQRRHILQMLEKSLARELDLEKKVAESRQIEEDLKLKLHSSGQEVFDLEEETAGTWERLFEADNMAEVLKGASKELLSRLQILQFNLNSSIQREGQLRSELQDSNEQLGLCKGSGITLERIGLLEKQLKESDILLQHAVATAEASQEKQSMLYCTIKDMENLIDDLKSKVSRAETRADSAEEKCITLSEFNSDLSKELSFLKGRMASLEACLHQADEAKRAISKDINVRTKLITDLVIQLALERDRLQKQICLLSKRNKVFAKHFGQTIKDPKHGSTDATSKKDSKQEAVDLIACSSELDEPQEVSTVGMTGLGIEDSAANHATVRNIDAGQLNFKRVILAVLTLVAAALAGFWLQRPNRQFL